MCLDDTLLFDLDSVNLLRFWMSQSFDLQCILLKIKPKKVILLRNVCYSAHAVGYFKHCQRHLLLKITLIY